jgi:hypothetical protein
MHADRQMRKDTHTHIDIHIHTERKRERERGDRQREIEINVCTDNIKVKYTYTKICYKEKRHVGRQAEGRGQTSPYTSKEIMKTSF